MGSQLLATEYIIQPHLFLLHINSCDVTHLESCAALLVDCKDKGCCNCKPCPALQASLEALNNTSQNAGTQTACANLSYLDGMWGSQLQAASRGKQQP